MGNQIRPALVSGGSSVMKSDEIHHHFFMFAPAWALGAVGAGESGVLVMCPLRSTTMLAV